MSNEQTQSEHYLYSLTPHAQSFHSNHPDPFIIDERSSRNEVFGKIPRTTEIACKLLLPYVVCAARDGGIAEWYLLQYVEALLLGRGIGKDIWR
ncbi:hypothetical protein BST61_g10708 [Cercospora zeina]